MFRLGKARSELIQIKLLLDYFVCLALLVGLGQIFRLTGGNLPEFHHLMAFVAYVCSFLSALLIFLTFDSEKMKKKCGPTDDEIFFAELGQYKTSNPEAIYLVHGLVAVALFIIGTLLLNL